MNEQNEATGEIFAIHISDKGFVSTICKELIQFNSKKQTIQFKNGQRSEQTFFQRRYTDGRQAYEKIFSITNY